MLGKLKPLLFMVALLLAVPPALARSPVNKGRFTDVAIKGYDPVAYFTQGQPVKGRKEYAYAWQGAIWRFASAAHREQFAAEPERFAPQYGGYCAYAVSEGGTAGIDPAVWTIHDGKLYLNYSPAIQARWLKDMLKRIAAADAHWLRLREE